MARYSNGSRNNRKMASKLRASAYRRHGNSAKIAPPLARQSPADIPVSSSSAISADMNRRGSFEDFAAMDTVIASMMEKVQEMAQIVQNAGSGTSCPSTSSIEQSIFLSPTFDALQPLMIEMQRDLIQGMQLFQTPSIPSREVIEEASSKMQECGEPDVLEDVRREYRDNMTWNELNSLKLYAVSDRQVMQYMRSLSSQSALPIFPQHLHAGNTFIVMGPKGAYFFAQGFLCRAPLIRNPLRNQSTSPSDSFSYEASDTDDDEC